ncbi:MAG: glycine--tRNA ligase subunit beta [Deltaproteobacteria bacterium]|nr:glycine--tRNA ligase subunit beta [Deltaproteobacteria bacterium]
MSDTTELLLEIGCEEIPAAFLTRALAELPAMITSRLATARLAHGAVSALGAPRRLAVIVKDVVVRQPDLRERVVGPPVGAAFGADGAPTKAAIGFAQKNGVDPATLERAAVPGKKGEYAIAVREVTGQDAMAVLPALLAELIAQFPWPKSMRWGWGEAAFVRPVHWIVALFGDAIVPFGFAGVPTGRATRGHRFLAPQPIVLANPGEYEAALRRAHVEVDVLRRRERVRAELARIGAEEGGVVRDDQALVDEVANLSEWPTGVCGNFAAAYLEVPEEIIVTALRTHQRYFTIADHHGKLMPKFVTMAGTIVRDPAVVARGNERAAVPRLADARYFVGEDRKHPLEHFAAKVADRVFLAKFGAKAHTYGHKIERIVGIVRALAAEPAIAATTDAATAITAARLCKADLATSVVGEFPELQGVMGMHYAVAAHGQAVGTAIAEHYMPKGAGAELPTSGEGALVALADRIDTLVGCFAASLEPSGSADPYGLRRAAIGILQILLARASWGLTIDRLIEVAAQQYSGALEVTDTDCGELTEFFRGRLRGILADEGIPALDADAALGADFQYPFDARARARALAVVPAGAREVFKRIANILDDAAGKGLTVAGTVDAGKFVADVERNLWAAFAPVAPRILAARRRYAYDEVFALLVELQPLVAAFFDKGGVMVMDPDPALRDNRLALLHEIRQPFADVADFRAISAAGSAS